MPALHCLPFFPFKVVAFVACVGFVVSELGRFNLICNNGYFFVPGMCAQVNCPRGGTGPRVFNPLPLLFQDQRPYINVFNAV